MSLLQGMKDAAMELAELTSYSEIVGGLTVNRAAIRICCDEVFELNRLIEEKNNKKLQTGIAPLAAHFRIGADYD